MKYLLLTLVLFYSCKSKDKPAPCKGHLIIVHQGHMPDKFNCGDTVQLIADSANQLEYLEQGYVTPIDSFHSRLKFAGGDSIEAVIIGDGGGVTDSGFDRTVTSGFKRVHHKKKPIHNIEFAPAGTKAVNLPYFQVLASREFAQIADSTGIVATRDSSGHWDIKDPARALEVMYKIVWKKDR